MNNTSKSAADMNAELLNAKPMRAPKTYQFKDGEFKVPTFYYCTKCGARLSVRPEVLIARVNKNYNGELGRYMKEATCSHCKKQEKGVMSDAKIEKLYNDMMARRAQEAQNKPEEQNIDQQIQDIKTDQNNEPQVPGVTEDDIFNA